MAKYGVEGLDVYTSTFVNMFYTLWDVRMGGVTIARAIALLTPLSSVWGCVCSSPGA